MFTSCNPWIFPDQPTSTPAKTGSDEGSAVAALCSAARGSEASREPGEALLEAVGEVEVHGWGLILFYSGYIMLYHVISCHILLYHGIN